MWLPGQNIPEVGVAAPNSKFAVDLSIEGMRSQRFSVGVFFFLLMGIAVFSVIIYNVWKGTSGSTKKLKTGEKVMFAAIIMGVIGAVIFGATQMVNGFLF